MPKLIVPKKDICFGVKMMCGHNYELARLAVQSVVDQTYPHWRLYLVGDNYKPREEFAKLASLCPKDKLIARNLRGHMSDTAVSAFSLDLMLATGIRYVANIDGNDLWYENHLELIAAEYTKFPAPAMVVSMANMQYKGIAPQMITGKDGVFHLKPLEGKATLPGNVAHSAVSWDSKRLPLAYRNRKIDTPWIPVDDDYDLWERMESCCVEMGYKISVTQEVTVEHR